MKLDFLSTGGSGGARLPWPRRLIERRMRTLDIRPLDDASRTTRFGALVALAFFGLLALFALLAPLSSAAIAPAEVAVSGEAYVVQPASSGIVSDVLVREGQAVRAGQPLVRLNGVRAGAQVRQLQASKDSLLAQEARLLAERDGAAELRFPPELARRGYEPIAARAMASQRLVFARRQAVLGADRGTGDQRLLAAQARSLASSRQLALISEELADYRGLYRRGFARLTTIRSLERTQAQLRADVATGAAAIAEARIAQARLRDSQMLETAGQLGQVQGQLAQLTPQLDVGRYLADQDLMRSPVAGRVSGITELGPGMVVDGGRELMRIVPAGRPLIVKARVAPGDIDDVRIGQEAAVRFDTVNPHGQTAFKGRVVTLSPARVGDAATGYYEAQITLDDPEAARRSGLELQPGIPASVNIKTRDRSLFDYIFEPFTGGVSRSFREE